MHIIDAQRILGEIRYQATPATIMAHNTWHSYMQATARPSSLIYFQLYLVSQDALWYIFNTALAHMGYSKSKPIFLFFLTNSHSD